MRPAPAGQTRQLLLAGALSLASLAAALCALAGTPMPGRVFGGGGARWAPLTPWSAAATRRGYPPAVSGARVVLMHTLLPGAWLRSVLWRAIRAPRATALSGGEGAPPTCVRTQPFPPSPPADASQLVDPYALWGYAPKLDRHAIQAGLYSLGDPARLRRVVHKLLTGEPVRVAGVGASISAGAGSTSAAGTDATLPSYLEQFGAWLRAAFPRSNATMQVGGDGCLTTSSAWRPVRAAPAPSASPLARLLPAPGGSHGWHHASPLLCLH